MEHNLTPDQVNQLKTELQNTKQELALAHQQQLTSQNPQDKFIEVLFDKGGEIFKEWNKNSIDVHKYSLDKETEIQKEELKIINKLDTKEKLFKGLLITFCIITLVIASFYLEKAQGIIPVLSLIIGLLFKSSTLSDFFSHSKRKREEAMDSE